jgi:hypothetical protein
MATKCHAACADQDQLHAIHRSTGHLVEVRRHRHHAGRLADHGVTQRKTARRRPPRQIQRPCDDVHVLKAPSQLLDKALEPRPVVPGKGQTGTSERLPTVFESEGAYYPRGRARANPSHHAHVPVRSLAVRTANRMTNNPRDPSRLEAPQTHAEHRSAPSMLALAAGLPSTVTNRHSAVGA